MPAEPHLHTERLVLRPLQMHDADAIQHYASDAAVALNTLNILHPYPEGAARDYLARVLNASDDDAYRFAITLDDACIGVIHLGVNERHQRGEIGYWVGKPHWGNGYMTEAARAVVQFAFEQVGLNRVYASHFPHNPASGRVMQKLGMRCEGTLMQHVQRDGTFYDLVYYGIQREDYMANATA